MGKTYDTKELAALLKVEPSTIRRGYCVNGHYFSLKPIKLPNRRLLWPADQAQKFLEAQEGKVAA